MSDCSTKAMLPKEQPKTCGTCGYVDWPKYGGCPYSGIDQGYSIGAVTRNKEACYLYMEDSGSLTLRYQQLEQVTREIFSEYRKAIPILASHTGRVYAQREFVSVGKFREQLEALGVDVDD